MSTSPRKILLATEASAQMVPELRAAADISASTGAPVRLVHIGADIPRPTDERGPSPTDVRFARQGHQHQHVQTHEIEARGGTVAEAFGVPGASPGEELVKLTRDEDVGLVMIRDQGLDRFHYASRGSVPAHVVRDVDCPVLVVRESESEREHDGPNTNRFPRTVLLATDGSRESSLAAEISRLGAALHVAHVYRDDSDGGHESRRLLDEEAGRIHEGGASVAGVHPRHGDPVEEILKLSEELDAELVVVGGGSVSSARELVLGTVSGAVVRDSGRSVMVVRGDREEKPLVDTTATTNE